MSRARIEYPRHDWIGRINMNKKILIAGVIALAVLASSMAIISEVDDGSVSADTADTYVAKIGDAKYQTLQSAFQAVESGQTIELLTDCTGGGLFLGAGSKTITLDFNGYTYTATAPSVGSPGTQTQAFHFEKGNTVTLKDGTLKLSNESTLKMGIQNYCTLTLNNFDVDASGDTYCSYAISNNFGSLTVTGGSDITAYSGKVAFDVYYWPNNSYAEGVTVTFDSDYTGTVSGKIEYGSDGTSTGKADVATKAKLVINAGTFISSFTVCNLNDNGDTGITINGGSFTDATCILYMSNTARITINGDCTLSDNATVPAGAELSIASNKTLTVASGKTLIVNGTLTVQGTLVVDATGNISCPVSFNSNGGSSVSSTTSSYNGLVTQPTSPTKSGYNFAGWYKESGLINAWDFSTDVVSGGTVLYAKWTVKPTPTPTPTPEKETKEVDPSTGYETTTIESSVTESGRTTTIDTVSEKSPSGAVTEVTTTIVAPTSSVSDIVVAEAIRQIEKVADGDVVPKINVMVSGQSAEIDLTKESIEAIADAGAEVVITSGSAEVVLDNNVVSKLSDGSGSVSVTVKTVPASQLNPEQRKAAENSSVILSASATVGSTAIHELGGTATVTLSYTLKDGEDPKNMKVTYLKDDGTTEIVDAVYDAENETITVKLDHFSFFAVSFATPVQGGADNTVLYICIAIAAIAIIGLVAYFGYFRTKKA
jgi:uncharacterized repeat protein (TIGR02543 family)